LGLEKYEAAFRDNKVNERVLAARTRIVAAWAAEGEHGSLPFIEQDSATLH
jgi:hypothetical protein